MPRHCPVNLQLMQHSSINAILLNDLNRITVNWWNIFMPFGVFIMFNETAADLVYIGQSLYTRILFPNSVIKAEYLVGESWLTEINIQDYWPLTH